MTTLLVQATSTPLMIDFPGILPMTEEKFYEFCLANRDLRIERTASGEVIIMSPAFSDTGNRNFNLAVQLGGWAERNGTGLGFDSSSGFTLPNGATRSPDAAWIKLERWNALTDKQKASFAPICPDFVIELRSASDTLSSLQKKMAEYIANGQLCAWAGGCCKCGMKAMKLNAVRVATAKKKRELLILINIFKFCIIIKFISDSILFSKVIKDNHYHYSVSKFVDIPAMSYHQHQKALYPKMYENHYYTIPFHPQ